jgi:hypothetical protein
LHAAAAQAALHPPQIRTDRLWLSRDLDLPLRRARLPGCADLPPLRVALMTTKLLLLLLIASSAALAQPHPSATFTWTWAQGAGDPATGFHVQRSVTAGGPYAVVGTVPVTTLTYLDTAVTVGATYYYVVTAYNSAGDSAKSNEVACMPPFQIPGPPAALSGTVK